MHKIQGFIYAQALMEISRTKKYIAHTLPVNQNANLASRIGEHQLNASE